MGYFDNLLASMGSRFNESYDESGDPPESSSSTPDVGSEMKDAEKNFKESELDEGCGTEGCSGPGCEDDEINDMLSDMFGSDDEDIDPADIDDLSGLDPYDGDDDEDIDVDVPVEIESVLGDPTPAEPLDSEDDAEADRIMALSATPIVVNDTMTEEEAADFIESGDADIAVSEGMIMQEDVAEIASSLMEDTNVYTESVFAAPGKKFKMTKQARLKQLFELSVQIEARQHNDPYYPKMQKAYKTERVIKQYWRKKYGALAMRRAKKYLKNLASSKSNALKNLAKKITGHKK